MGIFNRYDPLKRFARMLFRSGQFVETAEWNEAESIRDERTAEIGDGAFGRISLRDGGSIFIDKPAGTVRLAEAKIWAGGYMHRVPEATLTGVPMMGITVIGIGVTEVIVTDVEDTDLKGIVPGEAEGEPLAARLRYDAVWARSGNPFYPIYTLIDGQLPTERVTPQDQSAELAVERHIRQTHGSHIVEGFRVSSGGYDDPTDTQTFIIAAGTLRAEGREVRRTVDQRFPRAENPTLLQVNGESHSYPAGGVVTLNNGPIESVQVVTVTKAASRTITHQLANGTDALPDTPVYSVQSITQGATTFVEGTSWTRVADGISWAPGGPEPSPGSTYTVNYRYTSTVVPQAVGRQTITLENAVVGEPVLVQYKWKLPRIDVIAIDLDGSVVYIEGVSSRFGVVPPAVAAPLAPLVRVENRWAIEPLIEDIDQRKVTEAEVRAFMRVMQDMQDRLSLVELEKDIQERDPASRRGSFVDPFINDLQRDFGIAQDAAVVRGILQLPIEVVAQTVDIGSNPIMLPYVTEAVSSQPFRTTTQKINRYLAFTPLPSALTIQPAIDRWNEDQATFSSSATSSFVHVDEYRPDLLGTNQYGTTVTQVSNSVSQSASISSVTELPFLRQSIISFKLFPCGPGETVASILFDGIPVATNASPANAQGVLEGAFIIPAGIRAGTKRVEVIGAGGSRGSTSFTGQGTLTITNYHTASHTHTLETYYDPVAQSFVLDEPRQVTGARVEFTARGLAKNPVVLELREDANGLPAVQTLAEGIIAGGAFNIGDPLVAKPQNWTEISYRFPTLVPANAYHWLAVLTADADHSIALAQLGNQDDPQAAKGYDRRLQQWIRRNPASGDFADGSNGVSWLIQPDKDLTYEVMAARYTALTRTFVIGSFDLGAIKVGGISDILVLLVIDQPSQQTSVKLELVRAGGEVISFEPGVALSLDQYLTETVTIRMVLKGTAKMSPIVMPDCQILWGRLKETASYVSEAVAIDLTNGPAKVRSVVEVSAPGSSSVAVAVGGTSAWINQTGPLAVALGDGWIEREYLQSPVAQAEIREKITLTGTPKDRPRVRKLRVRATEV